MGKFIWRFSDRLPVSFQASISFVCLVVVLSSVSFSMLPKSSWGENFSNLLFDVTAYVTNVKNTTLVVESPSNTSGFSLEPASLESSSIFTIPKNTTSISLKPPHESSSVLFEPPHKSSSVTTTPLNATSVSVDPSFEGNFSTLPFESFPFFQTPSVAPSPNDVAILMSKDENASNLVVYEASPAHISEDVPAADSSERLNSAASTLRTGFSNTRNKSSSTVSVSPVPSPTPELITPVDDREKFIAPLLSFQVGAGNQMMEYISAAVVARSLNRTLCLSPFYPGPSRHTEAGRVRTGLAWMERYEVSSLSRFTRVATWEDCLQQCDYTLNAKWMLKTSREPAMQGWKKYPANKDSWNLKWDYVKWTSLEDIFDALGSHNDRCVGLLGLFPGLRWRGAFLAVSAFLRPALRIINLADMLQDYALGKDTPYMAVHWRFEESECGSHSIGLCFVRCSDGSVIDSGLHPQAKEWHEAAQVQCNRDGHFRGVKLEKLDILDAIQERAVNHSVKTIYFATDGWMRGPQGIELVQDIVQSLRQRGLTVVGLWKIQGLPNFADGKYFDPIQTLGKDNQDLNGAQIALIEQELCSRAITFMGSGQSTWSLAVFRIRLARRRVEQILEAAKEQGSVDIHDSKAVDELISQTLLKDEHAAGLHCRYTRYMKRYVVNETVETYADEYPDGWLDLEACEGRIGRGGSCQVAKCF